MADNVAITAGSGTTVRTWDRSAVETQVTALDVAQTGESELLGLGHSKILTVTSAGLTTASTNYASGDQGGTEITLTSAVRTGKGLILQNAVMIDKAKVVSSVDLLVFQAATTPASDNAAASWSDADMLNLLAQIHFSDLYQGANNYVLQATNLPVVLKPTSGTSLYFDFVVRAATTFVGAVGDWVVNLGVTQD